MCGTVIILTIILCCSFGNCKFDTCNESFDKISDHNTCPNGAQIEVTSIPEPGIICRCQDKNISK